VELSSPDAAASVKFYGDVMGWTAEEPGPDDQTGGYRMFMQDGKSVAGLMPHMQPDQPTAWGTYIAVADADATAATVAEAGGAAIVAPMDVMDIGRMAWFTDPGGAAFGVWQSKAFTGADVVNEPNSLCWNEVLTRDAERAKAFYTAVFGWDAADPGFEGAGDYVIWELAGKRVGGMMPMTPEYFPAEVPPYWSVCFAVADCDAIVANADAAGATVRMPPMDMQIGRFAGLVDPQGAGFTVMQMTSGG
jgi:hypothetical protein